MPRPMPVRNRAAARSEGVRGVEHWPPHSVLKAEAAVAAVGGGLIVDVEHAKAHARRKRLVPFVSDCPVGLRRRAPAIAARIRLEIEEPFVVDPMARFHSDDL